MSLTYGFKSHRPHQQKENAPNRGRFLFARADGAALKPCRLAQLQNLQLVWWRRRRMPLLLAKCCCSSSKAFFKRLRQSRRKRFNVPSSAAALPKRDKSHRLPIRAFSFNHQRNPLSQAKRKSTSVQMPKRSFFFMPVQGVTGISNF